MNRLRTLGTIGALLFYAGLAVVVVLGFMGGHPRAFVSSLNWWYVMILVGIVLAIVAWSKTDRFLMRRKHQREDEKFWQAVDGRRAEVAARLREWEEAEGHAREEDRRQQQEFLEELAAQGHFKKLHERAGENGEVLRSTLTEEERIKLGLELSPDTIRTLQSLMPFLTGPRPSPPEISEPRSKD